MTKICYYYTVEEKHELVKVELFLTTSCNKRGYL